MNKEKDHITKIYIFPYSPAPTEKNPHGWTFYAMEGDTGRIIHKHDSTNLKWGYLDMGFSKGDKGKTDTKGEKARKVYAKINPNFELIKTNTQTARKNWKEIDKKLKQNGKKENVLQEN